jgi:hypothetical protein
MAAATYLTIWTALALFVLGEIGRSQRHRFPELARWARMLSAGGLLLAFVHTLLAFDVFHQWSHADAVRNTAQQTEDVFGMSVGAGVYVNYLFFAVWLLDVVLWRPVTHGTVSLWVIRAFYLLIIFNGAVVFAAGWRRWLGLVLVGVLALAWLPRTSFAPRAAQ